MQLSRRFIADRATRSHVVIVSTPSLAFLTRLVEAETQPSCRLRHIPFGERRVEGCQEIEIDAAGIHSLDF